ncbi:hypothetical protein Tco_0658204 [Tanacetum coccineum]
MNSFRFEQKLKRNALKDYEYVNPIEGKEVDELESEKADFSNIYDLLLEECVSKDVTCSYLHSLSDLNAYAELQCLYLHKVKECECLETKAFETNESVNKEASFSSMTFAHKRLELSIHDNSNETVKFESWFQKFVPIVVSSYLRQELELLFHHHIAMMRTTGHKVVRLGINPMIQPELEDLPKDNPKLEIAVLSRHHGHNDALTTIPAIRVSAQLKDLSHLSRT